MDEISGGTSSVTPAVFDGEIKSLPGLEIKTLPGLEINTLPGLKQDGYTKDGLIQQAAMMLFANTNFETCGMTPESVARISVERAKLLVNELGL